MPRRESLPEPQPESCSEPLEALRLKLKRFKARLLFAKRNALSPLPDLAWREGDLSDLDALVHDVYMAKHVREGTTRGKELMWVNSEYQGLRLFKTIGDMIEAVPVRPVAAIQRELLKIDPSYNPVRTRLTCEKEAILRHEDLKKNDSRYRSLVELSAALGESKSAITRVPVHQFSEVLRELCSDIYPTVKDGFALHSGNRIDRLISQVLFLDLQRRELVWRLAYWDEMEAMARWVISLHNDELTALLATAAVYVPETRQEYLTRRKRVGTQKRVAKHRSKHLADSD